MLAMRTAVQRKRENPSRFCIQVWRADHTTRKLVIDVFIYDAARTHLNTKPGYRFSSQFDIKKTANRDAARNIDRTTLANAKTMILCKTGQTRFLNTASRFNVYRLGFCALIFSFCLFLFYPSITLRISNGWRTLFLDEQLFVFVNERLIAKANERKSK